MDNNVLIRESRISDSASVYSLLRVIAELHKSGRPDIFVDLVSKYTEEQVINRLSQDDNGVFVAEIDSKVIGYIFCETKNEGDGKTLYIDDLCVDRSARRMGVGRMLVDKARAYAEEKGCNRLLLNVWEFNKNAIDFYEDYGFSTRSRHMEMNI